jgi:membrane protease YdiL (CAAX protease family)
MTFKRIALSVLTLIVVWVMGGSLVNSLNQPQVTSQLQLYQTDLLLQASPWQPDDLDEEQITLLRQNLLGQDPLGSALKDYQQVRQSATDSLVRSQTEMAEGNAPSAKLQQAIQQQAALLEKLDLRIGILQAEQGEVAAARQTWDDLYEAQGRVGPVAQTAEALTQLWQPGSEPTESTEPLIRSQLRGWFRDRALHQLYTVTGQDDAVTALDAEIQARAASTVGKLAVIGGLPTAGFVLGLGLLGFVVVQRLFKGKEALIALPQTATWETPWTAETVWQVLIVGFFFVGQLLLPVVLQVVGLNAAGLSSRGRALYSLTYYLMMSAAGLGVLYWSVRPFLPLPSGWFRVKLREGWWLWGLGSYLAVLPLMIGVSIVNQQLWQGQGGSNPLLQLVLEEADPIALGIFFFTAAIAAPVFEEILFRGFLLPSLTRYLPIWGAIGLSSLIFAAAHLSLSEVLPLTVLGSMLGFVYVRSRNLLSAILLHSAWNSATLVGLFLLGSAAR